MNKCYLCALCNCAYYTKSIQMHYNKHENIMFRNYIYSSDLDKMNLLTYSVASTCNSVEKINIVFSVYI